MKKIVFGIALAAASLLFGANAQAQSSVSSHGPTALDRLNGIEVNMKGASANLNLDNLEQYWPTAVQTTLERQAHRPGDQRGSVRTQAVQSIDYDQLIPLLIQAVKEQQTLIDQQREEIERLKSSNP